VRLFLDRPRAIVAAAFAATTWLYYAVHKSGGSTYNQHDEKKKHIQKQ